MSAPVDAKTDTDTDAVRREGDVDEAEVPTTRAVAETLGVAGDRLRQFVEYHTAPSVANVVAFADSVTLDELDAETRAGIDRWIADVRAPESPTPLEDADETGDAAKIWTDLDDVDGRYEDNHD
jgi:hypothetical protein